MASGCKPDSVEHDSRGTVPDSDKTLTVFAAASLTDVFSEAGAEFERTNPGVEVVFNFAGSQSLRTQIEHGAQADLYASANAKHMNDLAGDGLVLAPRTFASNRLVVVVPRDNPGRLATFADLATTDRIVLAGPDVPAGAYAERVVTAADRELGGAFGKRVMDRVVSRELDVRQALQKVVLGEANAALVYATDAASAGDKVKVIDVPERYNVVADYPIARHANAQRPGLALRFVEHLQSARGRATLERHGFSAAQ